MCARDLYFDEPARRIPLIEDADVIVVNMVPLTARVIESLKKCKRIIRHGAGYDNVDVAACTAQGIPLAYCPDYCTEEVAEQAIALILACARQIPQSRRVLDDSVARGKWDFTPIAKCYRMAGRTLGIVLLGLPEQPADGICGLLDEISGNVIVRFDALQSF